MARKSVSGLVRIQRGGVCFGNTHVITPHPSRQAATDEAFFRIERKSFPCKNLSEEKAQFYLHFPFFMLKLTKK